MSRFHPTALARAFRLGLLAPPDGHRPSPLGLSASTLVTIVPVLAALTAALVWAARVDGGGAPWFLVGVWSLPAAALIVLTEGLGRARRRCETLGADQSDLHETLSRSRDRTAWMDEEVRAEIAARQRAEACAAQYRRRMDALMQDSRIAYIVWDKALCIREWNASAERIFGYTRADVLGAEGVPLVVPDTRRDHVRSLLHTSLVGNLPLHGRITNCTRDGRLLSCDWYNTPLGEGADQEVVSLVLDPLECSEIERLKSDLMATVSHELRTPLTAMQGALGLLGAGMGGSLEAQAKRLVAIAQSGGDRLTEVVNDVLEMQHLRSGRMVYHPGLLVLDALLGDAVAALTPMAARAQVQVDWCAAHPALRIWGDAERLQQVFRKLIGNGIQLSQPGQVVEVAVRRFNRETVRITITDRGPGIPPDFQGRVFQAFSHADNSRSRPRGGLGIGLAMAREIVEQQGGSLSFVSQAQMGTTFLVDFPLCLRAMPGELDEAPEASVFG